MNVKAGMKYMMKPVVLIGLVALSLPIGAHAWIFSDKKEEKPPKVEAAKPVAPAAKAVSVSADPATPAAARSRIMARAHMRFQDDEEEKQLVTFIAARRRAQEDFAVVTRLIEEKQLEIGTFNKQMMGLFGVDPDRNYQFEADEGIIYELVKKSDVSNTVGQAVTADQLKELYDFKVHRSLTNEVDKTRFLRLAAGKQLAGEQIRMLSLLQNEKEIESATVHEEMVQRYAISMDREYRYDGDTKTLFELVEVPADYVEPTTPSASAAQRK